MRTAALCVLCLTIGCSGRSETARPVAAGDSVAPASIPATASTPKASPPKVQKLPPLLAPKPATTRAASEADQSKRPTFDAEKVSAEYIAERDRRNEERIKQIESILKEIVKDYVQAPGDDGPRFLSRLGLGPASE